MKKRREPVGMHSSELEHAMEADGASEDQTVTRDDLTRAWDEGWTVGRDYALEVERGSVELAEREFYRSANPYR